MPVNSTHPDYDVNLPAWTRARDVIAGEDAVKAGGEKYLPRLEAQPETEHNGLQVALGVLQCDGAHDGRLVLKACRKKAGH